MNAGARGKPVAGFGFGVPKPVVGNLPGKRQDSGQQTECASDLITSLGNQTHPELLFLLSITYSWNFSPPQPLWGAAKRGNFACRNWEPHDVGEHLPAAGIAEED
jgi:hypothetical protein